MPDGSAWEQEQRTNKISFNHWALSLTASIARLSGNELCIDFGVVWYTGEYGTFYPPSSSVLWATVDGTQEETYSPAAPPSPQTQHFYYTTTANAGVAITANAQGYNASTSRRTLDFTAPALLSIPLYVFTGMQWYRAESIFVYTNGVWQKGTPYFNTGTEWTEIV